MVRAARRSTAILDADVIGRSRLVGNYGSRRAARLVQHRVERLEPAVARHGGRLVKLADDGTRAEFPSAAEALGAAIEFQQAMADANRGQPEDTAVVFRLGLHLGDASDVGVARRPGERAAEDARRGGIVVSAGLRDAVAGRVRASFAELGSAGLGTVERPIHAYEVGWDPADWPAESAKAATAIAPSDAGKRKGRWAIAIAGGMLAAVVVWLASAHRPPPALVGRGVAGTESAERLQLERRAAAAFLQWLQSQGQDGAEQDEADDQPANPANAPPADAYDGLYAGTETTRADSHVVTFKVKVTNGIGSGTQSRLDCGTAPVALKISRLGQVSGMALIFGSTCLKTELAVRGRAVGGTLRLMLGSQFVELSAAD
jgi:class 3 adenylate cyclase